MNVSPASAAYPAALRPEGTAALRGREQEDSPRPAARVVNGQELSAEQLRLLDELQRRDREVRAHEAAHVAAGAGLVRGGASYTYQVGPDGRRYAVGGEVRIDTSAGATPAETLAKAERIRAAALAPANPSAQDYAVAAEAARLAQEARAELAAARQGDGEERTEGRSRLIGAYDDAALQPARAGRLIDTQA